MKCQRMSLIGCGLLAASAMAASVGVPTPTPAPAQSQESDAPAARTTLTWSVQLGQYTWPGASQAAADYTGEGYSDWRLPTVAEAQAGVATGVYGSAQYRYWTSKHQGNWDYWVDWTGASGKDFWNGVYYVRFVRP